MAKRFAVRMLDEIAREKRQPPMVRLPLNAAKGFDNYLSVNRQPKSPILADCQLHGFNVPIIERLLFLWRHLHPGVVDDVVQHVVDVYVKGGVQSGAELGQERGGLDRVAGVGAEVVQEAVDDIALLQGVADIGAALIALDHDEEVDVGEALDQCPVVAVARYQNDRIDAVGIQQLPAGAACRTAVR